MIDITDLIVENPVRQRGASRLSVSRMAPSRVDSERSQIDFEFGKTAQCTSIVNSADVKIVFLPVIRERTYCFTGVVPVSICRIQKTVLLIRKASR